MFSLPRTIIAAFGAEARTWLNDLLTQDVEKLSESPLYAGLLSPQGKALTDMILWPAPDNGVLIECDPSRGGALFQRLSMYKLRRAVELKDASAEWSALWDAKPFEGAAPDPRLPSGELGWRALAPKSSAPDGMEAYRAHRIAVGVPDLAEDCAPDEIFALEALFEELHGVDFHKGCFVGQENVSRMKRRATTRKKFCPLNFGQDAPAPGTPVMAGEAEIGDIRASHGRRALALLRLDRAEGQALNAAGLPARLDPPAWLILPATS